MTADYRLRVYYEDTDAVGIVYYANYLKFIERARTEALLARGLGLASLRERHGVAFVVREVTARYLAPARLEDQLVVTTRLVSLDRARIVLAQDVLRDGQALVKCRLDLACIGPTGRPVRIPLEVAAVFRDFPPSDNDI
jgi:acyl-CoA thioester hydrolase